MFSSPWVPGDVVCWLAIAWHSFSSFRVLADLIRFFVLPYPDQLGGGFSSSVFLTSFIVCSHCFLFFFLLSLRRDHSMGTSTSCSE